ncbi:chromosome segregation protein SMC [Oscillatoria sp. FACHB-1406]|uniref:chromosome segregation protein SMC n=1 Tax=Oscillatoria sp. FACHB-1406 TaxID=2692846 RepID=UPI001683D414|nr:chromosome segregation protein SMC [Oscillatoria sp. FACHB-1406]MBD2577899.1 chromosome segregation protein SMC [Oscillatoria sp. FACHB-1406]
MVHIKRVELSHFKSFGGTTQVPLLPGFTVVSGPNGSGKSNILDALLFALGLASSKGMRAERLPDLVNHKQAQGRNTAEVSVSVTFDLEGLEAGAIAEFARIPEEQDALPALEWTVTRRLRVTKGGSYSSTFYINGETCTATELHQFLNRLRIYPEGYNVVLQGDVTRIITMNARERREIIDELAGVAEFDRQIGKVRETLGEVKEREERCHIIEEELTRSLEKLAADRTKAEKYQKLKEKIQEKQRWEAVLLWRSLREKTSVLQAQIEAGAMEELQLTAQLTALEAEIGAKSTELDRLNAQVKALGEEEQLSVASSLATQKAKYAQLQQQKGELAAAREETQTAIARAKTEIEQYEAEREALSAESRHLRAETLTQLQSERDRAQTTLETARERATAIAAASQAWVAEQTALSKQVNELQQQLNPQRTEQAQLAERDRQLAQKILDLQQQRRGSEISLATQQETTAQLNPQASQQHIWEIAERLAALESECALEQETQKRLQNEQREKQRQLDKLEATAQAQQESLGTYASQAILQANLPGVCGLVAQLGRVEPSFQLALETSAGARLGNIVVEDDGVAAAAIELLKQRRAGRATFLPLNKIRAPQIPPATSLRYARGFVDYAVNLVSCEPRYREVFAYVFGATVVFETLNDARSHLGQLRMVTLEGDILESSGAMTGGSQQGARSTLHFGKADSGESREVQALRDRIAEIDVIVKRCEQNIREKTGAIAELSSALTELRQQQREQQLRLEQGEKERDRLVREQANLDAQLGQNQQELEKLQARLQLLTMEIPQQEVRLAQLQEQLTQLEASQTHSEWLSMQQEIKRQEGELQEKEAALREAEARLQGLENQQVRLGEKVQESRDRIEREQAREVQIDGQIRETGERLGGLEAQIQATESQLAELTAKMGEVKAERDRAETSLQNIKSDRQHRSWQLEKLQQTQQERQETLTQQQEQLNIQREELIAAERWELATSDETPESPLPLSEQLEQLQQEIRSGQKRLEAMEPVNMLALQEYERTQERLQELTEKVTTLEGERTELLLRIETFTTLRLRAFKEAFDAVNENFQQIFATLSEGDGYLELENAEDPFVGGLNLVAHPKGKPVQRLSSMSGGEKSLTALSFIFSLQRYRPSPFYAFDEVDMFLDGANVERLSSMIKQQAKDAQFIVVSLRRPMIEASQRTIGVTQARGAHTQVLGIKL